MIILQWDYHYKIINKLYTSIIYKWFLINLLSMNNATLPPVHNELTEQLLILNHGPEMEYSWRNLCLNARLYPTRNETYYVGGLFNHLTYRKTWTFQPCCWIFLIKWRLFVINWRVETKFFFLKDRIWHRDPILF